jgi:hypothetical protein
MKSHKFLEVLHGKIPQNPHFSMPNSHRIYKIPMFSMAFFSSHTGTRPPATPAPCWSWDCGVVVTAWRIDGSMARCLRQDFNGDSDGGFIADWRWTPNKNVSYQVRAKLMMMMMLKIYQVENIYPLVMTNSWPCKIHPVLRTVDHLFLWAIYTMAMLNNQMVCQVGAKLMMLMYRTRWIRWYFDAWWGIKL